MSNVPVDFDFAALFPLLERAASTVPAEEREAIEIAARCLHYVNNTAQLEAFREHLRSADRPAEDVVRVAHEFISMAAASAWLESAPAVGTLVKVGGKTHSVWRDEDGRLVLLPSFTPQELDALSK